MTSVSDYFASTYQEARGKFLAAAEGARARLSSYQLPDLSGPSDEELAVDVAVLGPRDPESVLLLISATHGVEGFCGSGCQVGFFQDKLSDALPPSTATVLVHALNPYGFAHLRRVTEDNVDLNRNFMDFSAPLPSSPLYEEIHEWLVPEDWGGPNRQEADAALQQYIGERGMPAFQAATTGGQYTRPTGLFYGGTAASWSNLTLRRVLEEHFPDSVKKVAVLDFHTGLGPTGYGEPLFPGPQNEVFERAQRWYGPEVTYTDGASATTGINGTSTSATVIGCVPEAFRSLASRAEVTLIALEYGTRPILEVLTALRADNWLHAIPHRETPLRQEIKQQIRGAFYVDTPAWKSAVYGRAADFVLRAGRGLASG